MKNRSLNKYTYNPKRLKSQSLFSKTYQGIIQDTGQPVYIKMIPIRYVSESGVKRRVDESKLEIEAFSKLRNEYMSQLIEVVESYNHIYIVSERGVSNLGMGGKKIQGSEKIFAIFLDLVIAVCHIKSHGYIHYNLVPGVIQLFDYGARVGGLEYCYDENNYEVVKKLGVIKNWQFMSPQQIRNQAITDKIMVWSVGVILYYMLFQRLPYQAKTKADLMLKMRNQKTFTKSDIIPIFKNILIGCLQPKPRLRLNLSQLLVLILNNDAMEYKYQEILRGKLQDIEQAYRGNDEQQIFEKRNIQQQIDNQIGYIYFLQRTCFLMAKMEILIQDPPLLVLTKFIIRCRVKKLTKYKYWKGNKINYELQYQYNQLYKNYDKNINESQLKQIHVDKYRYFTINDYRFKQIIYLQYQAFIRQYIQKLTKEIMKRDPMLYQQIYYSIFVLDFIVTIFQLSQDLITQNQQQNWRILGHNWMRKFAESPLVNDVRSIFQNVLGKIKSLNLLDDQ